MELTTLREHAVMIENPLHWCRYPFLPIRRDVANSEDGFPYECALLMATSTPWSIAIVCNLFMMPKTMHELLAMKKYRYASTESLLADGWRVD